MKDARKLPSKEWDGALRQLARGRTPAEILADDPPPRPLNKLTGEDVARFFKEAASKRLPNVPTDTACAVIAKMVNEQAPLIRTKVSSSCLNSEAQANAHALLAALPEVRRRVAEYDSFFTSLKSAAINPHTRGLAEIDRLDTAIRYLTSHYGTTGDWDFSWHLFARLIGDNAREAWRQVNGKAPKSRNPEGPLCLFVGKVLAEIGEGKPPSTVSEALKERRGPGSKSKGHLKPSDVT